MPISFVAPVIPSSWGLIVGPFELDGGGFLWAEVEPAPKWNWRPMRGRMSLWWYEVHSMRPGDECGTTWAYIERGSGGAFSFRRCIDKAQEAAHFFAYEYVDPDSETPGQPLATSEKPRTLA